MPNFGQEALARSKVYFTGRLEPHATADTHSPTHAAPGQLKVTPAGRQQGNCRAAIELSPSISCNIWMCGAQVVSYQASRPARSICKHAIVAQAAATEVKRAKVPAQLEEGDLPMNTFSPKKPFKAKIKSVERIVGPKATGETCHIIVDTNGDIPFWEGQSYGVIPPVRFIQYAAVHQPWGCRCVCLPNAANTVQGVKVNSKGKEVPLGARLYSIASTRYGDNFDGETASLCVRRATYWDPENQAEDPAKKGICSNFLCAAVLVILYLRAGKTKVDCAICIAAATPSLETRSL